MDRDNSPHGDICSVHARSRDIYFVVTECKMSETPKIIALTKRNGDRGPLADRYSLSWSPQLCNTLLLNLSLLGFVASLSWRLWYFAVRPSWGMGPSSRSARPSSKLTIVPIKRLEWQNFKQKLQGFSQPGSSRRHRNFSRQLYARRREAPGRNRNQISNTPRNAGTK
jgi:hypothetical protein